MPIIVTISYRQYLADFPTNFKCLTFRKLVKVTECNLRNDTIRWQMPKSTNVFKNFCASSYRFRYIFLNV